MLAFQNLPKTIKEFATSKNVFADIYEDNSPFIFAAEGKVITKGCNTFEGQYGTQHSIGLVMKEADPLTWLFEPCTSLGSLLRGWTRKPIFKGNDNDVLFIKLNQVVEVGQGAHVNLSAATGIHFNCETKTYGVYFKKAIIEPVV